MPTDSRVPALPATGHGACVRPGDAPDELLPTSPLWAADPAILRLAMRDDYLSSVPKFLLGLRDMCFHPPTLK